MVAGRVAGSGLAALLLFLGAAEARAQVCLGFPTGEGQLAVQGHVMGPGQPWGDDAGYGARLGVNLNTPLGLAFDLGRPRHDGLLGTVAAIDAAVDLIGFHPTVCPTAGLMYREQPRADGERDSALLLPLGVGFARTLGWPGDVSLSIFAQPQLLYALRREGALAEGRVASRTDARGVVGIIVGLPLVYAIGSVQASTLRDDAPAFSVGVGLIF